MMTEDSLKWGIPREDWESDTAKNIALALCPLALFALTTAFATIIISSFPLALALTTAFAIALIIIASAADNDPTSIWYRIFRFPGAYLHYRKRTRSEKP